MKTPRLLLLLSAIAPAASASADTPHYWEAESGRMTGSVTLVEETTASGGTALRFGRDGQVEWIVDVAESGRYELNFRFRTTGAATWPSLEVNGRARDLGLAATAGRWHETARTIALRAGANTISLQAGPRAFDLDTVRFTMVRPAQVAPLYELPAITPKRARVDLRNPQPLQFVLRQNGHESPHLTIAGHELSASFADFEPIEDAVRMRIPQEALSSLPKGTHPLRIKFAGGAELNVPVMVSDESLAAPLLIASLDVSHGKATLLRLPDGQVALIDCATEESASSNLLPFLATHGIDRIDHLFLTHYHGDHVGGLEALRTTLPIGKVHDYRSYNAGDGFELGGAQWFVLNAYDSGEDENSRSLSLQVTYRGFVYTDGADIYARNQRQILERFPERVRTHVYYGNHHFHGSVDINYLRRTDAVLFLVSAGEAVYARAAFAEHFLLNVEAYLKAQDGRLIETLLTAEVGNTLVRVHDAENWTYETLPPGGVFPDFMRVPEP